MEIVCNNTKDIINLLKDNNLSFEYGSNLYGINSTRTSFNIGVVVPNDTIFVNEKRNNREERIHNCKIFYYNNIPCDIKLIKERDFVNMIKEFHPFAIESIFIPNSPMNEYQKYFKLNKGNYNKLLKKYYDIAKEMWINAQQSKKANISSQYYYDSIRLLTFAKQCIEFGGITDYKECVKNWEEIKSFDNDIEMVAKYTYLICEDIIRKCQDLIDSYTSTSTTTEIDIAIEYEESDIVIDNIDNSDSDITTQNEDEEVVESLFTDESEFEMKEEESEQEEIEEVKPKRKSKKRNKK